MRFFTPEWRGADETTQKRVAAEYQRALQEMSSTCPAAIMDFVRRHTVHDGQVTRLEVNPADRSAVLHLHGWNPRFDERRLYTFVYRDLEGFCELGPADSYGRYSRSIDASFDEFNAVGGGIFEHCILFHSDVELQFAFKRFDFSFEVTPLRRGQLN